MSRLTPEAATELQRLAADPSSARMVNANAGSGKTKVLVDRVSRILLQGTDPGRILCLTYTRAAASEMQERLFDSLSKWAVADDATLRASIHTLYGRPMEQVRPAIDIDTVRTSFARALETPEGLKVMTIHAFCERIIGRFPVEAGILPGFSALDDAEGREMMAESRTRLLERAVGDDALAAALHRLTRLKADSTLDDLLYACARDRDRMADWARSGGLAGFRKAAGLGDDETEARIAEREWAALDPEFLSDYADRCIDAGGHARTFGEAFHAALTAPDALAAYTAYTKPFFTGKGTITSQLPKKDFQRAHPFITPDSAAVRRVADVQPRLQAARLSDTTEALLTLGAVMAEDHAHAKHQARGLDFNDLIVKTRDLLKRRDVSDWIAYKLDGGVEHVLLDEAQDTSPTQWEIIDSIVEPFAQDSPDRDAPPRTFFAVGDPKQSIYRFQGAAPGIFMDSVRTRTGEDGEVRLRMSFRSAQEVLDVVDALFLDHGGMAAMFDAHSVPEASDLVRHDAFRQDAGLVELWPLAPASEPLEDREPWDTTPVDATGDGDPRVVLARTIAEQIRHWLDTFEPVYDRDLKAHRPMRAGDVLILVQKRVGGLFDALIKALKEEGLPVAGADRLVLQDAVIVRDLLALTRFVLLPGDCLSLAEVLKSPLFGLDDDQLFALCVDRGDQDLWDAVRARDPDLAAHLQAIRDDAGLAPFDFYARTLDRRGPHGLTYRRALFGRLGMEAKEALDAFLSEALAHQQRQAPSLLRFLQAFTADTIEIKRDKDPAGAEIRVMTVHGAKGLEAPVVFLPDTTRAPRASSGGLIPDGTGGFILAPSGKDSFPLADTLKQADHAEAMREYMRLLYVAMTRAESRLVLCGYHHGRGETGFQEESWYHWFLRTFPHLDTTTFPSAFDGRGRQGLRYGRRPARADAASAPAAKPATDLPDWIDRPAPPEPARAAEATPSALLRRDAPVARGPGAGGARRGIVIHSLLEHLPDHPPSARARIADQIIAGHPDFLDSERARMKREVFAVLDHPDFADVFAEGSRAEASLAGRLDGMGEGGLFLTAQVDRLSVVDGTVHLVDYKSGHAPPEDVTQIDAAYLAQMAAYRELARQIWPDHAVRCGLLWTEGPALTWLPDAALDAALTQVREVLTSESTKSRPERSTS